METKFSSGQRPLARIVHLQVTGYLTAAGDTLLSAAQLELEEALSYQYGELVLKNNDASNSATLLTNVGSLTGVLITSGPSFDTTAGPEYVNQRKFTFEAMAEYPFAGTAFSLVSFEEAIAFSGGYPIYDIKLAVNGNNQKQLIYPIAPYEAIVTGSAYGYQLYPSLGGPFGGPPLLWPNDLMEGPMVELMSPKRIGAGFTEMGVKWQHRFKSNQPLIATPRYQLWI